MLLKSALEVFNAAVAHGEGEGGAHPSLGCIAERCEGSLLYHVLHQLAGKGNALLEMP